MKFPAYVPMIVRTYLSKMIDGGESRERGWNTSLESSKQEIIKIEKAIESASAHGEVDNLVSLRQQLIEAVKHRDFLAGEVECLRRLLYDDRMRDAYALLIYEISDDEKWCYVVDAAWAARGDFSDYRERLKQADEQKVEIANTAAKLASQLDRFSEIGITGPGEFFSVRDLLRKTDNDDSRATNSQIWRDMRKHVVGDYHQKECRLEKQQEFDFPLSESDRIMEVSYGKSGKSQLLNIRFISPGAEVRSDPLAELRYGWEKAPPLSALLRTVAKAAEDFEPVEEGMIGAALASRQGSVKSEYIRAFAYLLFDRHRFDITPGIMRAMATIATVVLNKSEIDVTYDDVRKAHSRPSV
jgi:hypothetical protein